MLVWYVDMHYANNSTYMACITYLQYIEYVMYVHLRNIVYVVWSGKNYTHHIGQDDKIGKFFLVHVQSSEGPCSGELEEILSYL